MGEQLEREIHDECAVVGVTSIDLPASYLTFQALSTLQTRGEEASGMATFDNKLNVHKKLGRVDGVYTPKVLRKRLTGTTSVGHNRYSTSGSPKKHISPIEDQALAYAYVENGNNPEPEQQNKELESRGLNPHDLNDSEGKAHLIASEVRNGYDLPYAVERLYPRLGGATMSIAMHGDMEVAFKDPHGIRPGVLGRLPDGGLMVASETSALDTVGAEVIREIEAGEMVVMHGRDYEFKQLSEKLKRRLDVFELLYFSSPDSIQFNQTIADMRTRLGEQLAIEHPIDSDIVIPVPSSGLLAGEGYADSLGIPRPTAIMKNRYIDRTFILPEQLRDKALLNKSRPIASRVKGKRVTAVDDTKVRGSTMKVSVEKLMDAGAAEVNVLIASPPVVYPDFYGIDTKSQDELIAANMNREEIRQHLGAHSLNYLSMNGMIKALGVPADQLNLSCFTGEYPIDIGRRKSEIQTPKSRVE